MTGMTSFDHYQINGQTQDTPLNLQVRRPIFCMVGGRSGLSVIGDLKDILFGIAKYFLTSFHTKRVFDTVKILVRDSIFCIL